VDRVDRQTQPLGTASASRARPASTSARSAAKRCSTSRDEKSSARPLRASTASSTPASSKVSRTAATQ
jgi:sRNA-binding protein